MGNWGLSIFAVVDVIESVLHTATTVGSNLSATGASNIATVGFAEHS